MFWAQLVHLITSGASGMGLATARLLLEAGADIVITGRDAARLNRAAEQLDKVSDRGARLFTVRANSARPFPSDHRIVG
ncbi:SDR family NAD(P)-dependent oxidoreductase [Streptomyces sp. NBC_01214]|uniref:SDR family NAD(P)-dependent oxidoreductase n=1 Tax=Streptomyces sp. NBC_01214 TaxID=2903777 RepID=UPI00224DA5C6|nr:SDR family NAD(P)-dependent oxidoreductase [Streptomyces sp. NBC_01214]MCX4804684.1 SDR family NAD(P)-dependent oxidoreductase [Streptomyces sp. NBC_01214]